MLIKVFHNFPSSSLFQDGADDKEKDPIDVHYENLKTELNVLDKETDEFKTIEKYVKNTHAETHNLYTLEIQDVFKVYRKGESKRFKPFKQLPNRKLLWHGSRTTNYAGILSQGNSTIFVITEKFILQIGLPLKIARFLTN